jgi:acyl-CoA dehydrogenase
MSEMREILVDTAARLFGDLCTNERYAVAEKGEFNADAWEALADAGLTRATVSEARGGDGADVGDALALVREAGRFALPLPLAETLVAELALAAAGLPSQGGVGTVGPVVQSGAAPLQLAKTAKGWELNGTL